MRQHRTDTEPHSDAARLDARQQNDIRKEEKKKSMKKDNGTFGIILGGLVALAAIIFIFSGGELGGKKTIDGDDDLPPIATADQN